MGKVKSSAREESTLIAKYVVSLYLIRLLTGRTASYCMVRGAPPSRGGAYHTLLRRHIANPAASPKLEHYSHHHQRHAKLKVDRRAIIAEIKREMKPYRGSNTA